MMKQSNDASSITVSNSPDEDRQSRCLQESLKQVLCQLTGVLTVLTDDQYTVNPVGVFTSSIGAHVRHCLDHVSTIMAGARRGFIDYDQRERGTDVERSREAALRIINQLRDKLGDIQPHMLGRPIVLSLKPAMDGPCVSVNSTAGRELAFVLSHTIHHNAIIAATCRTLGVRVPESFGVAPSTIAYMENRRE